MLKLRKKLEFKLTLILIIIIVMIIGISRYFSFLEEKEMLLQQKDEYGHSLAHAIAISILEPILIEDVPVIETFINQLKLQNANIHSIKVWRKDQTLLVSSDFGNESNSLHYYTNDIKVAEIDEVVGYVDVYISSFHAEQIIKNSAINSSIIWLLVTLVLVVMIYVLLKKLVINPLYKLEIQTNRLREGHMEEPVVISGNNEFSLLAKTLDDMRIGLDKYRKINESQKEELKLNNYNLEVALKKANSAVKAKTDFLANMSHEIRTPMNGIFGVVQLIESTKLTDEQSSYIKTLEYSTKSLLTIINDILDYSKIDAGKLEFENININLNDELKEIKKLALPLAKDKSIQFKLNTFDTETFVYCDPVRLSQILLNLISNAIKFTHDGSVELNLELLSEKDEILCIQFEVKDTGIGISTEKLTHIFDKFTQADSSTTREFGGTGLGLSISRKLVELMGGKLNVKSKPGEGSAFSFILSLIKGKAIDNTQLTESGDKIKFSGRVLLVEDNYTNRLVTNRVLEKRGVSVMNAENGVEAIELFKKTKFDLVLMDMQMPIMDGVEATTQIRQLFPKNQTPIVAMTANALTEHREQCKSAGMCEFMTKPLDIKLFDKVLIKYLPLDSNRSDSVREID